MYIGTGVIKRVPEVQQVLTSSTSRTGLLFRIFASKSLFIAKGYSSQSCLAQNTRKTYKGGGVRTYIWKYLPSRNGYTFISLASLLLQRTARQMGSSKVKWGHTYFWQFSRRGNVFEPDHFLLLWCQTLRHRPAGPHGIICPQQEKPWRCGKRCLPLTMLAGQPKVWTADNCFAEFYFRNCKNTRV